MQRRRTSVLSLRKEADGPGRQGSHATFALLIAGFNAYIPSVRKKNRHDEGDPTGAPERIDPMNIARSFQSWRRYRETVGELNRLTQRELADLGMSRADIPAVARRAAR